MAEQGPDGWESHFLAVNDRFSTVSTQALVPEGRPRKEGLTVAKATDLTLAV